MLNASTIIKGGGIQAVVSFIRSLQAVRDVDIFDWHLVVSEVVFNELKKLNSPLDSNKDIILENSPSKDKAVRKKIIEYVELNSIACVFTFFGPSYIRFSVPHICGVADGWVTHADREAYSKIRKSIDKIKMFMLCFYKGLWFRTADAWFVEQEAARRGLIGRWGIAEKNIHIISNNCSDHYRNFQGVPLLESSKPRVLIFASYYPNKNIESIPLIARAMKDLGNSNFEFVLTIDSSEKCLEAIYSKALLLGVKDLINNVGTVSVLDGPSLYRSCNILLMPSVLETFSAVYPEAMAMGLPIVTADKEFSRAICSDAALYYPSNRPEVAAAMIDELLHNKEIYESYINKGAARLETFPTAEKKYLLIHEMIEKYIE
jgi:glycosyltransferase involved in cell wall biosynthesis